MSFYRWLDITVEVLQSCSAMAHGGRKGNTLEILVLLRISFFDLFFFRPSFFFFTGTEKEVRREQQMVRKDIGVCKGNCQL
jgi:hypothetical protein